MIFRPRCYFDADWFLLGYWRGLSASASFSKRTLEACLRVLHMDIIGVWNVNDRLGVLDQALLIPASINTAHSISCLRARNSRQ
jgi:hypothetical protein